MADQVQNVTIRLLLQQLVSGPAGVAANALKEVNAVLKSINVGGGAALGGIVSRLGSISGILVGFGGAYAIVEAMKQSLELARNFETNQARLNIALDGNVSRFKEIQTTIEQISKSGVYSQSDLTSTAQSLIERGVPRNRVDQTLQVVANTASALRLPLNEVAEQIAQTFGGVLPRALSRAVPEIKQLSEESLRAGGAIDVLMNAFKGRDAAFAATAPGREAAQLRDIAQAWTDIGKELLPLEREILPHIASYMREINDIANAPHSLSQGLKLSAYGWIDSATRFATSNLQYFGLPKQGVDFNFEGRNRDNFAAENNQNKQRADQVALQAEAFDAAKRAQQADTQLDQMGADRKVEISKKAMEESVKLNEEEFQAKTVSLQTYLDKVDAAAKPDQSRIQQAIDIASFNAKAFADQVAEQKRKQYYLQISPDSMDPQKDLQKVQAIQTLEVQISDSLQHQVDATKDLHEAQDDLHDSLRKQLDDRVKAIQEATKSLVGGAAEGKTSVENGTETADQLQTNLARQFAQIQAALPPTFGLIDKIYSPADAATLKQRLTESFADAKIKAKDTADSVTPVIEDLLAIGKEARKAAINDAASEFTDFEFHVKSAKDALNGFLESFLKTVASMVNQRLFTGLANGLLGPTDAQGNSTGSGLIQNVGGSLLKGILSAFDTGGYTGRGDPSQVAGIVHRNEQVIPSRIVNKYNLHNLSPDAIGAMLAGPRNKIHTLAGTQAIASLTGNNGQMRELINAVKDFSSRPIVPVVGINEDLVTQISEHPSNPRLMSQVMLKNPSIFRDTIRRLQS